MGRDVSIASVLQCVTLVCPIDIGISVVVIDFRCNIKITTHQYTWLRLLVKVNVLITITFQLH